MPSYFDHWFGVQDATIPASEDHTLQITDGELVVDFSIYDCEYGVGMNVPVPDNIAAGWALIGPGPWQMLSASLKGGGYYANSLIAHGQALRQAVFDNVTESFEAHLKFFSPDGMIQEMGVLEELLLRRAVKYWTNPREFAPVYIARSLPGESGLSYAILSQGSVVKPANMWSGQCAINVGFLKPVLISFVRQPFWLGAAPGTAQSTVELTALQDWEFQLDWAEDTDLPTGYIYSFAQTSTGVIFASGQSEILQWASSTWSAVSTAPITLAEAVTSSVVLSDGTILFGGFDRIIRRTSAGLWETETTLPSGQVNAMFLANTGVVYAGDNGRILARATDGTWSIDTTLPLGHVYSFAQTSDGSIFAGEEGRILKTTLSGGYGADVSFSRYSLSGSAGSYNDATEFWDGSVDAIGEPTELFANWAPWVGFRFTDVAIPPGAIIRDAKLRFRSTGTSSETGGQMRIYGERSLNPSAFVESTRRLVGGSISATLTLSGSATFIVGESGLADYGPGTVLTRDWQLSNMTFTGSVSSGGTVTGTVSGGTSSVIRLWDSPGYFTLSLSGSFSGTLTGDDITGTISLSGNYNWQGGPYAEWTIPASVSGTISGNVPDSTIAGTANVQGTTSADSLGYLEPGIMSGSGTFSGSYTESAISSGLGTISTRTRTTNSELWTMNDAWITTQDWRYESPDLTDIVQEIVNQTGWASRNAMAFLLNYNYVNGPRYINNHAYLDVTYVVASAEETVWEVNTTFPTGNVRSLLASTISDLLLAGDDGRIIGSDDFGLTWGEISALPTNEVRALYEAFGYTYAGDDGNILRSPDGGRNWGSQSALPTGYVHAFILETATNDLRAADDGRILILDETLQISLGRDETTGDDIFVVNHHKECNLTHIFRASTGGTVFSTSMFPITVYPASLFAGTVIDNDAIYFGVDTSNTDSGPFCNLIFDIAQAARTTVGFTVNWEYWTGAAWVALTVHDETNGFREPGVHGVFWKQDDAWAETAVNGVTGWWVRARLSGMAGTFTVPTQQNRTIYSCITPFVDIDNLQLGGNVPPLIQLRLHNRSDEGGPGGSEPLLYMNRVWIGAKETASHEDFRAYLNFAGEQNAEGITLDVSIDPDGATSEEADTNLSSATGRRVFFDAGTGGLALNTFQDRVEFELDTTIARDYYGTYMPLLICAQSGGDAGEVTVRIKIVSGSGGISKIGDTKATQTTIAVNDHETIVFDSPITIPVSSQMTDSDIGDQTSIIVQISTAAVDADLFLYGLFLQPVDDAWAECEDNANTAESSLEDDRQLLLDSISIPKAPTRAVVQHKPTNAFVSTWHFDSNGEARLICKENQRLWFHFARTTAADSSVWISEPEACCSVRLSRTDRWLFGRGAE